MQTPKREKWWVSALFYVRVAPGRPPGELPALTLYTSLGPLNVLRRCRVVSVGFDLCLGLDRKASLRNSLFVHGLWTAAYTLANTTVAQLTLAEKVGLVADKLQFSLPVLAISTPSSSGYPGFCNNDGRRVSRIPSPGIATAFTFGRKHSCIRYLQPPPDGPVVVRYGWQFNWVLQFLKCFHKRAHGSFPSILLSSSPSGASRPSPRWAIVFQATPLTGSSVLVSAVVWTIKASYLVSSLHEHRARYRRWAREGIGTRVSKNSRRRRGRAITR
ncbi:hypothetical protein C8R46DRAFT_1035797 [Mycena filopes]|nr:hypothetical protein C8R46DRAFT_1035797 [Mycena filopes]